MAPPVFKTGERCAAALAGSIPVRLRHLHERRPGDFAIMPPGHDAWVLGDEPCVVFDWQGFTGGSFGVRIARRQETGWDGPGSRVKETDMTRPSSSAEQPVATVARFNVAWGNHDLDEALSLTSEDCVFESTAPPDGQRYAGRTAIRSAWKPIFDDQASQFTVEDTFTAGNRVVQHWRYDWDGGHVRGIDIFTVNDGLITEKLAYVKG